MDPLLFGEWLKRRRRALDFSREQLADRVGCAPITIKKIEADERRPSATLARRIAQALELSATETAAFLDAARTGINHAKPTPHLPLPGPMPYRHHIPEPLTPLIGRQQELRHVQRLLRNPQVRLLTIVGVAGVGKTHLAIAAALHWRSPTHNIFFVELASIQHPDQILGQIAHTIEIPIRQNPSIRQQLSDALQQRPTLLILDNFEHVIEGALQITELLQQTPHLRILITSRSHLHLRGEYIVELTGLSLPAHDRTRAQPSDAEKLFLHHVQAIRPNQPITTSTRPMIAEICRRLDGLPLAIELATSRLHDMPLAMLHQQMANHLDLFHAGPRDLPDRQQSLYAAFEWSLAWIDSISRSLFLSCALFLGAFDRQAAAMVADLDQQVCQQHLDRLISHHLLQPVGQRFRMLESLRMYAEERLAQQGQRSLIEQRMIAWAIQYTEEASRELGGAEQRVWFHRLDEAFPNLRGVLAIARAHGDGEAVQRIAARLFRFWQRRGLYREGQQWLEHGLALAHTTPHTRAFALHVAGTIATERGDFHQAEIWQREAIQLARQHGPLNRLAEVINNYGITWMRRGDSHTALTHFTEAVTLAETIDHWHVLGHGHNNLGLLALDDEQFELAEYHFDCSLQAFFQISDWRGCAFPLNNLIELCMWRNDRSRARVLIRETLALWAELNDTWGPLYVYQHRGWMAFAQGQKHQAAQDFRRSLEGFTQTGDQRNMLTCCDGLAACAHANGAVEQAAAQWQLINTLRHTMQIQRTPAEQARMEAIFQNTPNDIVDIRSAEEALEALAQSLIQHPSYR
ncbi:MAG: hypothetical protein Fur005_38380 [Roseiflexaceae bacterium]